jgi:hypothetical protein
MGWAGHAAHTETGSGNRKGRDHFGDLVIDARILLKCMLEK